MLTYLDVTKSKQLDANGYGVIAFPVDVGQYWWPTIVHVGTRNVSGSIAQVGLHAGGTANNTDNVSLKDYTWFGNNDSSSILAGTIAYPNTAIVLEFIAGNPFDIAWATVNGVVSNQPPAIEIVPSTPGVRFAGSGTFAASGLAPWRPNKRPIGVFTGALAVNATFVILSAVAGRQYFLHSAYITAIAGVFAAWSFQDTNANDLGIYSNQAVGAPVNSPIPPLPGVAWEGSPLDTGTGLQLKNLSGGVTTFTGHVTYGY